MIIGIPKERRELEMRVGLTPYGVNLLTRAGHVCYVEKGAGEGSGFSDYDYERAGGRIAYSTEEVYRRADMVLKAVRPTREELEWTHEGQIICGFLHLAAARRETVQMMLDRGVAAVAYETIEEDDGTLPVLRTMSEVAGRMAPQLAATFLQSNWGGRGVLLSGVPGVPAARVAILGAGVLGTNAARAFYGLGATLYILDQNQEKLRRIDEMFEGRVTTMVAYPFNIARVVRFVEVLVGARPGARRPGPRAGHPGDGPLHEEGRGHPGLQHRPGRMRGDQPAHHPAGPRFHRGRGGPLLCPQRPRRAPPAPPPTPSTTPPGPTSATLPTSGWTRP
jgi:alanine dehydrogenase